MKNVLYMILALSLTLFMSSCTEILEKFKNFEPASRSEINKDTAFGKVLKLFKSGTEEKVVVLKNDQIKGIYLLPDGTYSTSSEYVVPKLTDTFLNALIDKLRNAGGGYIWLSYIDDVSKDNECLYVRVTSCLHTNSAPDYMSDGAVNYQKNRKNFLALREKELKDSIREASEMKIKKQNFLAAANSLLTQKVYVKSDRNKLSDVKGSVQSAIKVLSDARRNGLITECLLIGFSDFQNDPDCPKMQPDSSIKVFNLISQPGKSKNCVSGSQEVMDVDYLLSILKL